MNLKPLNVSRSASRVKREPLKTFIEMADELGVSLAELRGHIAQTKLEAPKPEFVKRNRHQVSWYRPSIFREWWSAHCSMRENSHG